MTTVSVVIISDYQSGEERNWSGIRQYLASLARQDFTEPVEYLLCEDSAAEDTVPADLHEILPGLQIRYFPFADSYRLKNAGALSSESPYVALLDADCLTSPNWLRVSVETLRQRPEVVAVSGRTVYAGEDLQARILSLLSRAYLDPGHAGATGFLSNNATVVRREVYERHPLPENLGAFSCRLQSEAMLKEGGVLWFEPAVRVVHDFEGWPMEADMRRNIGWGTITTRLEEDGLPHTGLVRLGVIAIPLIYAGKLWNLWQDTFRCYGSFGIQWWEIPYALLVAAYVTLLEIPGMWLAYQQKPLARSAWR